MCFPRIACVATALFAAVAQAQSPTATLVGTVRDGSGASIAGAAIGVRNVETGEIRNAQSQPDGEFTVPNLPPRKYEVTIAKTGFRTLRETSLELKVDQGARLDAGFNDENPRDSGAQARPPLARRLVGIQNAAGHDTQLRPAPHLPIAFPTGGPPASRPYSAE
jgi:hypothetical protein